MLRKGIHKGLWSNFKVTEQIMRTYGIRMTLSEEGCKALHCISGSFY